MPASNTFVALRAGVFVPSPVPGTHVSVASVPGGNLVFGFNPSLALAVRPGDTADLALHLEHGGTVTITGFFESCDGTFPLLILPDGEVLAAVDLLRIFDLDMATAAGPDHHPASGGLNQFADASGTSPLPEFSGSRLGVLPDPDLAAPEARTIGSPLPQDFAPHISIMPVLPETRLSGTDQADRPGPVPALFSSGPEGAPGAFPPVYTIDERGLGLTVDESLMPGGLNAGANGAPGYVVSFLVATNNGFASVIVNGTEYAVENGTLAGFDKAAGTGGFLSGPAVVGQGNGLYVLSFIYTRSAPHAHSGEDKDTAAGADVITIAVNGVLGTSSATSVRVSVTDDVPLALDDYRHMAETDDAVAGNVLAPTEAQILLGDVADLSGYDGWAESPVTLLGAGRGAYGALVMESDGSYLYTRNALDVPDTGAVEIFTYQVTDGDGDMRTATLTISLAGAAAPDGNSGGMVSGVPAGAGESGLDDAMWTFAVLNAGSLDRVLDSDDADAFLAVFGPGGNNAGTLFQPGQGDAATGQAPDGPPDGALPERGPNPPPADGPAWDQTGHLNSQDPADQARALIEIVSAAGG